MEKLASRQNQWIRHFRRLGREAAYRRERGEFLCDGEKLLREALSNGAQVTRILWRESKALRPLPGTEDIPSFTAEDALFEYVSPMENSPGPLFTVARGSGELPERPDRVMVLENLQDPGNIGTVLRTAAALGTDLVVLCGKCADLTNPKTVRSTMGAVFRQRTAVMTLPELDRCLREWDLPLYGAALAEDAVDVRSADLRRAAVAVGNEGNGLSDALLALCEKKIIIPMTPGSESLNAAVAASILMWEMDR